MEAETVIKGRIQQRSGLWIAISVFAGNLGCHGLKPTQTGTSSKLNPGTASEPVLRSNDRPSDAEPVVPGYFIFCRDQGSTDPNTKNLGCGLADDSNKAVIPFRSAWNYTVPTAASGTQVTKKDSADATSFTRVVFSIKAADATEFARVLKGGLVGVSYQSAAGTPEATRQVPAEEALQKGLIVDDGSLQDPTQIKSPGSL